MKKRLSLILAVVMLAALFAACGGNKADSQHLPMKRQPMAEIPEMQTARITCPQANSNG
jgi:outer membrane PBP1 activator LpoA protein